MQELNAYTELSRRNQSKPQASDGEKEAVTSPLVGLWDPGGAESGSIFSVVVTLPLEIGLGTFTMTLYRESDVTLNRVGFSKTQQFVQTTAWTRLGMGLPLIKELI
jgi:hypothetical protein